MTGQTSGPPGPIAALALDELAGLLPDDRITSIPAVLDAYREDGTPYCHAGQPVALIRPTTTAEVSTFMAWADRNRIVVVPQGSRTGVVDGASAIDGCVLLSLERMDKILDINEEDMLAVVQPGVINSVLSQAVLERGLFYPPDPSSWETSSIGGNVATNAGGLACVKYGVTADFVRALEVVLADGRVTRTGHLGKKGVSGYDLTRLFVGSEGTLGIVTEITVTLLGKPGTAYTAVAFFGSDQEAFAAVCAIMRQPVTPSILEFMDKASMDTVSARQDYGFPEGANAMIIIQSDRGADALSDLNLFAAVAEEHGGSTIVAADEEESEILLAARRSLGKIQEEMGAYLSGDVSVTRSKLTELVARTREISARHDLVITCTGHAGDGNLHPTICFDPHDEEQVRKAHLALDEVTAVGLSLGGTISGEHGIGQLNVDWLPKEIGAIGLDVHRRLKAAFDPHWILNPGRVIRPPENSSAAS